MFSKKFFNLIFRKHKYEFINKENNKKKFNSKLLNFKFKLKKNVLLWHKIKILYF